jgi:hypothetical protein
MTSLLVAGIVDSNYDVSTSFAAGLLRFQQKMSVTPKAPKTVFEFFADVESALAYAEIALKGPDARVAVVDASMGIDPDFLLQSRDFPEDMITVAAYPLRELEWGAVSKVNHKRTYPNDIFVYNFEKHMPAGSSSECKVTDSSRILMPVRHKVQAKVVNMPVSLIPEFRVRYDSRTHEVADIEVMIDVTAECTNAGPYDFSGCVATHLLTKEQLEEHTLQ